MCLLINFSVLFFLVRLFCLVYFCCLIKMFRRFWVFFVSLCYSSSSQNEPDVKQNPSSKVGNKDDVKASSSRCWGIKDEVSSLTNKSSICEAWYHLVCLMSWKEVVGLNCDRWNENILQFHSLEVLLMLISTSSINIIMYFPSLNRTSWSLVLYFGSLSVI